MDSSNVVSVLLKVNGKDVEQQYEKLNKIIADCNKNKKRLEEKHKGGAIWDKKDIKEAAALDKELRQAGSSLKRLAATASEAGRVLDDLSSSSMKDLTRTLKSLEKAQDKVSRGSKEWKDLAAAIRRVKEEMAAVREENNAAKAAPMITAGEMGEMAKKITAFAGSAVDAYAALSEAQADVRKYTGLTAEEIEGLSDELGKIDTRTSILALHGLAAEAGKLGIRAKEDVAAFVRAADKINVALGDDLGEGAVTNIMRLSNLFGETERLGIEGALMATGSAINELSKKADAGALMDFTARLGGVAKQAGMTQAEVIGLAASINTNMISAETGATALSNFITKMYAEPAKFIRVFGLEAEEFNRRLGEGANSALMMIFEAANRKGGLKDLAPMLRELDVTGAGVSKMFNTFAANYKEVIANQQEANAAFTEGVSVGGEFNLMNTTVQAELEKNRAKVEALKTELGRGLYPVYIKFLETLGNTTGGLGAAVRMLVEYKAALYPILAVLAAYTAGLALAAVNAARLKTQEFILAAAHKAGAVAVTGYRLAIGLLRTGIIAYKYGAEGARRATNALKAAMAGTPWGALAAVIGLAASALASYAIEAATAESEEEKRAKALSATKKVEEEAEKETAKSISRIKTLSGIVNDNTAKIDARRAALAELRKTVPAYHAELTDEGKLINNNTAALDAYIKGVQKASLARVAMKTLDELNEKILTLTMNKKGNGAERWLEQNRAKYEKASEIVQSNSRSAGIVVNGRRDEAFASAYETQLQKVKNINAGIEDTEKQIKELQSFINSNDLMPSFEGSTPAGVGTGFGTSGGGSTPGGTEQGRHASRVQGSKADPAAEIKARTDRELVAARLAYQAGLTTYLEYEAQEKEITRRGLRERFALYKEGTAEYEALKKEEADLNERYGETAAARAKSEADDTFEAVAALARFNLERRYIDEEQYGLLMLEAEKQRLKKRLEYAKKYGSQKDILAAEKALQDHADKDRERKQRALMERLSRLKQQYNIQDAERELGTLEEELAAAADLLKALNIPLKEQERILEAIRANYKEIKGEIEEKKEFDLGTPNDALLNSLVSLATAAGNLNNKIKDGKAGWDDYAKFAIAAIGAIVASMQAASEIIQANQEIEINAVEERYDREIKAAEGNDEEKQRLEEEKAAEVEKVKKKYAEKEFKMKLAMAIAQTAQNALMAYGALAGIFGVGPALAAAAAAMALATGAIQIAAIRKQKEAAGYYEGGFTGGKSYRRAAGVVHEGEFVANHAAVNNPALRPMLEVIDRAQRANTVANLTAEDVTRTIAAPALIAAPAASPSAPAAPVVVSRTDPETTAALARLNKSLERGITAVVSIDGRDGVAYNLDKYRKLTGEN